MSNSRVKYWFIAMICVITGIVGTFLTFHATLVYVLPLLFAIQYRERSVLWFSYFADGIAILVSMLLGFYYGICDLNMLYASNHTRAWYLGRMTGDVIPIPFNADVNFVIVVYGVFPRMITLLVFVVMLRYIIISNQEDATRIAELTYRKEMDVSTRLFNKNKYEEMIEQYYPQKAWVAAIFPSLTLYKAKNSHNPSVYQGCGCFDFCIDIVLFWKLCYFFCFVSLMIVRISAFDMNS